MNRCWGAGDDVITRADPVVNQGGSARRGTLLSLAAAAVFLHQVG